MGWKRNWKEDKTSEHHFQTVFQHIKRLAAILVPTLNPVVLLVPIHLLQWTPLVVQGSETLLSGPAVNIQFHSLAIFFFIKPDQFPILVLSMGLGNSCTDKTKWVGGVRCRAWEFPKSLPLPHLEHMIPCPIMRSQRMEFICTQKPSARATCSFKILICS